MIIATIPTDRADLLQRLDHGERIAADAEAAGDWSKFHKAMIRVYLRRLQLDWIDRRPADAKCWKCGELEDGRLLSIDCLAHRSAYFEMRARDLAARDCEGLPIHPEGSKRSESSRSARNGHSRAAVRT